MPRIQPAQPQNADQPKKKTDYAELLFFIALNVLVVPFSTYQTYIGYQKDVAGSAILALIVAAISGVFFLAMNFGIRESRLKGEKHFLKVIMYIVPLAISVPGNFNAFYSNQMRESQLRTEVSNYKYILNQTRDKSIQKIEGSINLESLKSGLNQRMRLLESEYKATGRTGWGSKCNEAWQDLVNFLNSNGGKLNYSDIGSNRDYFFSNAERFATSSYDQLVLDRTNSIKPTIDFIDDKYNPIIMELDSIKNSSKPVYTSAVLDNIVEVENLIRSKAIEFLDNSDLFAHEPLKPSDQNEIGTIKHSFNSAFIKWESPTATVFSLFLSLIIDFAALLYILVFIPFNTGKKKGRIEYAGPNRI